MVVTTEKPSPLPQNCALSSVCLHRSSASPELPVSSPSLPVGSSESPQPSIWPLGLMLSPNSRVVTVSTKPVITL
jgi:hypothetical protein